MKNVFLSAFTVVIVLIAGNGCTSGSGGNSYVETAMSLEEQEKTYPNLFLEDKNGTYRRNIFGEWVLEGSIINSAKIASYKDVELNVSFYSKTNTLLGQERHTIYEFFEPQSSKEFKIKTFGYKGTSEIGWSVINAQASSL